MIIWNPWHGSLQAKRRKRRAAIRSARAVNIATCISWMGNVALLPKYGTVTARIKQCVTVKCYSTIFLHDSYKRNAVKHAFEGIVEQLK